MAKTYADSGVDIERGDEFASYIRSINTNAAKLYSPIAPGGFATGFAIDLDSYREPVVLSTTDGVGTKLLVARSLGRFETIGIDLVAMCVNDLIVHGAKPVHFLDYIACSTIDRSVLDPLIEGIAEGCRLANCVLAGGETAELRDMYEEGSFDLAGFAVGVAERSELLPNVSSIHPGARLVGLPSSGIHSNGFSLARSVIDASDEKWSAELIKPTRIYVRDLLPMISKGVIAAAANITGGGLAGNLSRVLPQGCAASLSYEWHQPEIFDEIRHRGAIEEAEMRRVFNLGIGMALVISQERSHDFDALADSMELEVVEIGEVVDG